MALPPPVRAFYKAINSLLRPIFPFLLIVSIAILSGFLVSQYSSSYMILGAVALAVFTISFVKIEFGLYILIFSMLLSPEFVIGSTGAGTLGRGVTLRLDDFMLVIICLSWAAKNVVHEELGMFRRTPLNKPIFFYMIACVIATGFGIITGRVEPKTGFFYVVKYVEYFIVYFMMINHIENIDQVNRFLVCLFLTCFITSIIGILQIPAGGRVSAPFEGEQGEPNTFGGYLLFIWMVAAGLFARIKSFHLRSMLGALLIIIIPPFLYTQSRSSYLGVIPAVFVLAMMAKKRVVVVGLTLLALVASPLFLPYAVTSRILYTFKQPAHHEQIAVGNIRIDTSTSARLMGWKEVMRDWTKHPLFGYGVTGYMFVDAQFPRVLIETGLIGLLAFIYLLYAIGKTAVINLRRLETPYYKGLTIGFIAGFIGLLFHSIGANTFIIVRIMEPFWFFAGIMTVLPILEGKNYDEDGAGILPAPGGT